MSAETHWVVAQRKTRVIQAIAASVFAYLSRIALQVGQVPVFLYFWSTERFGEWLLITSVPSYLSLSGLGFGTAAGNAISKFSAEGDERGVRTMLRAAWLVLTASCLTASLGLIAFCALADVPGLLGLKEIVGDEFLRLTALLCVLIFLRMQFGLVESAFRAVGRYPRFVFVENTLQLVEFAATVLALAIYRTPGAVVISMILVRLLAVVGAFLYFQTFFTWIVYGSTGAIVPCIAQIWKPSLGFLIIPLSQVLNLQGFLLVIGHFFGPTAVAVVATARTLARVVESAINLIFNVVYEEVGYAAGARDVEGLQRLFAGSTILCAIAGAGASTAIMLLGPTIYAVWTHGKIELDYGVMTAVVVAGLVRAFWTPAAALLAGLNLHTRYSIVLLVSALVSLLVSVILVPLGLSAVAASPLILELVLAGYVFPKGLRVANMTIADMARLAWSPTALQAMFFRSRKR